MVFWTLKNTLANEVRTANGTVKTGYSPIEFLTEIRDVGVGEIVINSIDCDGMMSGYPFELFDQLKKHIDVPMTIRECR